MSSPALQVPFERGESSPDKSHARIPLLIARLEDLQNASATLIELVRCGAACVPYLGDALIHGKPRSIPQFRLALVDGLSMLGASDVLVRYLQASAWIQDPAVRFAEDVVISAAARALKGHAEAYGALLKLARERAIPGVLEALAMYRREELIPYFIRAFESDVSREIAISGLRPFGEAAKSYLLTEALLFRPSPPDKESTSSVHRRRACLQLLENLSLDRNEVRRLWPTLFDSDAKIAISFCRILLRTSEHMPVLSAVQRLRSLRPHIDWILREDVDDLLRKFEVRGTRR